ncbi:hypothetical protein EJ05DRAFT_483566 [Pseudovirgaria hyperparasitica]|uniref:F-box domain-containing protein n=1 Tax=Pseudovirgaria hyperparasitica TaxID=470096 RepID=A0A6A6WIV7_9PEZI|nr:uncharacterized protein EJ05DRAFT_483566 [Pseudovirgaria hyperparasitica]KAF2761171.1 hypothetical protein EJ05DRAFT_483566 [Pseudovirgaria hyperparasitica]
MLSKHLSVSIIEYIPLASSSTALSRTTTTPMTQSQLLSLPSELLDKIYKSCLTSDKPIYVTRPGDRIWEEDRYKPLCLALLQTCKQINDEATQYLYDNEVFLKDINAAKVRFEARPTKWASFRRFIVNDIPDSSRKCRIGPQLAPILARTTDLKKLTINCKNRHDVSLLGNLFCTGNPDMWDSMDGERGDEASGQLKDVEYGSRTDGALDGLEIVTRAVGLDNAARALGFNDDTLVTVHSAVYRVYLGKCLQQYRAEKAQEHKDSE